MSNAVLIEVTQDDIYHGEPHCPGACPLALAIRRHFRGAVVYDMCVIVAFGWVPLPVEAEQFVADFDAGFERMPFSFELDVPEEE